MAKARGKRRKGVRWEYDGDGRFPTEKYTTFDKRYWRRYWRREGQKEVEDQTEGIRLDEEPASKAGAVKYPLRVRVSHLPLDEVDIPDR